MALDITGKQASFAQRYGAAVTDLIRVVDRLVDLKTEYDANGYAPDGVSTYKLTDAVVQNAMTWATATQVLQAVGAVESIRTTVASNRGYLEALRG